MIRENIFANKGCHFKKRFILANYEELANLTLSDYTFHFAAKKSFSSLQTAVIGTVEIDELEGDFLDLIFSNLAFLTREEGKYDYDVIMTNTETGDVTKIIEGILFLSNTVSLDSIEEDANNG